MVYLRVYLRTIANVCVNEILKHICRQYWSELLKQMFVVYVYRVLRNEVKYFVDSISTT